MLATDQDQDGTGKGLSHYFNLLKRNFRILAGFTIAGLVLAAAIALTLPDTYRSTATILIEEPEVPPELIGTTVTSFAERRLAFISQRIMSTENLSRIIREFDLYPSSRDTVPMTRLASRLRASVELEKVTARIIDPNRGRNITALTSFNLSFSHGTAEKAREIAAEFTRLYLETNARDRQEQTRQVASFLSDESGRLSERIDELEGDISQFKLDNPDFVPGQNAGIMLDLISRTEAQVRALSSQLLTLEDRELQLQRELEGSAVPTTGDGSVGDRMTLPQLRAEYARITQIYGQAHPDVVRLRSLIRGLEANGGATPDELSGPRAPQLRPADPTEARLQSQLRNIQSERYRMRNEKAELEERLEGYEKAVLASPRLERRYLELQRDYENARAQYDATRQKQLVAEQANVLEQSSKGERFTLLEPPVVPSGPAGPPRALIIAGGTLASLLMALAGLLLFDLRDDRIHSPEELQAVIGAKPLAIIPLIRGGGTGTASGTAGG